MKTIGNLGGILYYKDKPLIKFKFMSGMLVDYEPLVEGLQFMPHDIYRNGITNGLYEFFIDRPTPDTRQGIHEQLKETPIQYYHVERMLRYCHAQSIHDCYWIEQDDDVSCWVGSPLEGIGIKPNKDWNNIYTSLKFK